MDELETMWDEAFEGMTDSAASTDTSTEPTPEEAIETPPATENSRSGEEGTSATDGETDPSIGNDEGEGTGESGTEASGNNDSTSNVSEEELAEINSILGSSFNSMMDFPGSRRYMELRENGRFTVKEAVLAVAGQTGKPSAAVTPARSSKGHLSSSRGRGSNGEVFTSADKAELSKWGFKSSGAELEKLWRKTK